MAALSCLKQSNRVMPFLAIFMIEVDRRWTVRDFFVLLVIFGIFWEGSFDVVELKISDFV